MGIVAYKNTNTGQVVAYPAENSRLEALAEWERTHEGNVTYAVADAHDRAAAQQASIEAAAAIRLDTAAGAAAAGIAAATAANTAAGGNAGQPLPTLTTTGAGEASTSLVGLLNKDDPARSTAATSSFEENKRRAEEEIAHPPKDGVLARAKRDQKSGAVQIGDNPEEHAGPAAAAAAGEAGDGSTRPADSADKAAWVDYAVSRGANRSAAAGQTKQQLIDAYGA